MGKGLSFDTFKMCIFTSIWSFICLEKKIQQQYYKSLSQIMGFRDDFHFLN